MISYQWICGQFVTVKEWPYHNTYSSEIKMEKCFKSRKPKSTKLSFYKLISIKPIHTGRFLVFYNHIQQWKGNEIIKSGWRVAGIPDNLTIGLGGPSIDLFEDINPMLAES